MRCYIHYYDYDVVGNFIEMKHTVTGGTGNWTRIYTTGNDSNRLSETVVGSSTPEEYAYDNRGNITGGLNHLNANGVSMEYNAENRLEKIIINSSRTVYYQYDNNGQRVRKAIVDVNSNTNETRKYVGEWEEYESLTGLTINVKRETLHISDDNERIALIDTRTDGTGVEPAQLLRYQYSNHLGTATLELDDGGAIISYEEYYPYGSTSFQSGRSGAEVSLKRYRYCASERDEETGLYYFGARYYIPWLARWSSLDPINSENYNMQKGYGLEKNMERQFLDLCASSYEYCYDNPINYNDLNGEQPPLNKGKEGVDKNEPEVSNAMTYNISTINANEDNIKSNTDIVLYRETKEYRNQGMSYGVSIRLVYTGNLENYEEVEWIQSITTSSPSFDNPYMQTYLDVGGTETTQRKPFYFPENVLLLAEEKGKLHGGEWFEDAPSRRISMYTNRDFYFMAETTLIAKKDGIWEHIATYGWGFSVEDGKEIVKTPIIYTNSLGLQQ